MSSRPTAVFLVLYSHLSPRQRLIAKALKRVGYAIIVVAWDRTDGATAVPPDADFVDEWRWVGLAAPTGSAAMALRLPWFYWAAIKVARAGTERAIFLITHFLLLPIQFALPGVRIYDAAEIFQLDFSRYVPLPAAWTRRLIAGAEALLVRRLNGILTTDSADDWLRSFYLRWNPAVEVLWNVPSLEDDPVEEEVRAVRCLYERHQVIAMVGGLTQRKGLRIALQSVDQVSKRRKDVLFMFIGELRDERAEIDRLIEESNIADHVCFLEWMPYRSLLAHLRCARIGLALHQPDPFFNAISAGNGRKFFTYMQAGIPVVAPCFASLGRLVKQTGCGALVDTTDPEAIADGIRRFLEDAPMASEAGAKGRAAFESQFNWEIESQKLAAFLDRLRR